MKPSSEDLRRAPIGGSSPVTSLTIFTFPPKERLWAFGQMGLARPLLRGVPGLRFRKLMGTGRGIGCNPTPVWERYALLAVWSDERSARDFIETSRFIRRYDRHLLRRSSVLLATLGSHGRWNGADPFLPAARMQLSDTGIVGVLTRAAIRPARLGSFWRKVGPVRSALREAPGLIASIEIGEVPMTRQATFSLWRSADAMKEFAYGRPEHRSAIERTRREEWYSEELFARFAVIDIIGEFP